MRGFELSTLSDIPCVNCRMLQEWMQGSLTISTILPQANKINQFVFFKLSLPVPKELSPWLCPQHYLPIDQTSKS
jgi:hypothetical protein